MKINEVEARVGITKKNIRFYESQGLLSPQRNRENGYRDYGEADVAALMQIKLMRKLGVPLDEIRQMQSGRLTLESGMRRHLAQLQRQARDLETAQVLCRALAERGGTLSELNADGPLQEMELLEREGTTFMNKHEQDTGRRMLAALCAGSVMILLMLGILALLVWVQLTVPMPPVLLVAFALFPAAVAVGVVLALRERLNEIRKGEDAHAARQY